MGMKKIITRLVAVFLVAALTLPVAAAQNGKGPWKNPYSDVTESQWSYSYIARLSQAGILPDSDKFRSTDQETRLEFVAALYAMHLSLGGKAVSGDSLPFTDVPADSADYDAVLWAYESGVVNGVSETSFNPGGSISRQDACTMLLRFAREEKLSLCAVDDAQQFADSLSVRQYARTPVTVCQMSGLVNGYDNGYFRPAGFITRQECAAVLCRLLDAAEQKPEAGALTVDLTDGAYDSLYDGYTAPPSGLVEKSDAVDLSYFDDAVFIGNSRTEGLKMYSGLTNATFITEVGLTVDSIFTDYCDISGGGKARAFDQLAGMEFSKVYIMLGMNELGWVYESVFKEDYGKIIDKIREINPDAVIYIQSIIPVSKWKDSNDEVYTIANVNRLNTQLRALADEKEVHYVDVAEGVMDDEGYLPFEATGDGVHLTPEYCVVWMDYLRTHTAQ